MPLLTTRAGTYPVIGGGGGYTGPGDVVGSAYGWWGLRSYNAAYATGSNPAIDIVDQANANSLTVNILADGSLDVAAISTWVTANSVTTIYVTKLWDQTGNGRHFTQSSFPSIFSPTLVLNGQGSLPVIRSPGGNDTNLSRTFTSISQPFTVSTVAKRTGSLTNEKWGGGTVKTSSVLWGFGTGNNLAKMYGGANTTATAADNTWHGIQYVFNGASSDINVDGSVNTVNAGTNSIPADTVDLFNGAGQGGSLHGDWGEAGIWGPSLAFSSTQSTNMKNNQQAYWGY